MGQIYTVVTKMQYIFFSLFSIKWKNKLTLINVVRKILKTFDTRESAFVLLWLQSVVEKNKLLEVEHVPQRPTAGGPCYESAKNCNETANVFSTKAQM